MLHNIIIGGVEVSLDSAHDLTQTYADIGGRSLRRMLNGAANLQSHWTKVRTTISGSGRLPAGLDGLDYNAQLSLSCMAPKSIYGASNSIVLPATRRSDWPPHGYAIVNGRQVPTSISIATNTATLGVVAGATGYVCVYYPTMTVYATLSQSFSGRGTLAGWTIEAEAV